MSILRRSQDEAVDLAFKLNGRRVECVTRAIGMVTISFDDGTDLVLDQDYFDSVGPLQEGKVASLIRRPR